MFVTRGDARLFTVAFGAGERTILALGGWAGNWELWAEPFGFLSRRWHTIAYDHRGTGATRVATEDISAEAMVDDLFAVMDAYAVDRCVLVAESGGATIALLAALQRPARFSGLVLVDGLYHHAVPTGPDPFVESLRANFPATVAGFAELCAPGPEYADVRRWGRQILERAPAEAAIRLITCLYGIDLRPSAAQIVQPTLLIHGDGDRVVPLGDSQWLAAQIPRSYLHVVAGAGHVPTMTHGEEVASAIDRYFA